MARYKLMGLIPTEHETNEVVVSEDEQKQQGSQVVYETDDAEEARKYTVAGGFFNKKNTWVVITGAVDSLAPPSTDIPVPARQMPQKGDI